MPHHLGPFLNLSLRVFQVGRTLVEVLLGEIFEYFFRRKLSIRNLVGIPRLLELVGERLLGEIVCFVPIEFRPLFLLDHLIPRRQKRDFVTLGSEERSLAEKSVVEDLDQGGSFARLRDENL